MKFVIVSCGLYNRDQIERNIESIDSQGEEFYHWIVVDNHDSSYSVLEGNNRMKIFRLGKNNSSANHVLALSQASGDIICSVDLDDYLLPGALSYLKEVYSNPNIYLTYGSYACASGKSGRFAQRYGDKEKVRYNPFKASHLKSFRLKLWEKLDKDQLKSFETGEYYESAGDLAMMFPLMEMAGLHRCKFIEQPLYWYNDLNENNDHKLRRDIQLKCEIEIRNRDQLQIIGAL